MSDLFLFNTEMAQTVDPDTTELNKGLRAAFVAIQDTTNGYPVYGSNVDADSVYANTMPQRIKSESRISIGQLLNISYGDTPTARLASATSAQLFANSVSLTATDADGYVMCAVKVAALPTTSFNTYAGSVYLSTLPGKYTDAPYTNAQILQKVGEIIGDFFYFYYHTPALIKPELFQNLPRSA